MRLSPHAVQLGQLRGAHLRLVSVAHRCAAGEADRDAGAGLSGGALGQQAPAAGLARAPGISLLRDGQARSGPPGTAHREGRISRVRGVHGSTARESAEVMKPLILTALFLLTGCQATRPAYDYTNFRAH